VTAVGIADHIFKRLPEPVETHAGRVLDFLA
jgi:hypothetical protein